jgi:hypothetical protein
MANRKWQKVNKIKIDGLEETWYMTESFLLVLKIQRKTPSRITTSYCDVCNKDVEYSTFKKAKSEIRQNVARGIASISK